MEASDKFPPQKGSKDSSSLPPANHSEDSSSSSDVPGAAETVPSQVTSGNPKREASAGSPIPSDSSVSPSPVSPNPASSPTLPILSNSSIPPIPPLLDEESYQLQILPKENCFDTAAPTMLCPRFFLNANGDCPKLKPEVPSSAESSGSNFGQNTHTWDQTVPNVKISSGRSEKYLLQNYRALTNSEEVTGPSVLHLGETLGAGSQGKVFQCRRLGADQFEAPTALKFYSPDGYSEEKYNSVMEHLAEMAGRIAVLQNENILKPQNWFTLNGIRIMEMELVEGFDLFQLLQRKTLRWMQEHLSKEDFAFKTDVVITEGADHPRLLPGPALSIIRDCLQALQALHENGILHGDIKPANVMLKTTGHAKVIDLGSAVDLERLPPIRFCTPYYSAPEVFRKGCSPVSDIASLGYVLIELLTGRSMAPINLAIPCTVSAERLSIQDSSLSELQLLLIRQKHILYENLPAFFPQDLAKNEHLVEFCRYLIHPDPQRRCQSAIEAVVSSRGISNIMRELVIGNLASEFDCDLQYWVRTLKKMGYRP